MNFEIMYENRVELIQIIELGVLVQVDEMKAHSWSLVW